MKTGYITPEAPGVLRVSAGQLAQRDYMAERGGSETVWVERDQPVHTFERSMIITDAAGDSWHVEAREGGGLRLTAWPKVHSSLMIRPVVSNVVSLVNVKDGGFDQ